MSREDIEKLLGGYATGTLTPEERDALFAAALEDQQLFEALAREEPLRELVQKPAAKTRLLAALERRPAPSYVRWLRPAAWAIPAVGLATIVVILVVQRESPQPVMIAQAPAVPLAREVAPVPSPLPEALEERKLPPAALSITNNLRSTDSLSARGQAAQRAGPSPKDMPAQAQIAGALRDQAVAGVPAAQPPPPAPAPAPSAPPPPAQPVPAPADKSEPARVGTANQLVVIEPRPAVQGQQGGDVQVKAEAAQLGGAGGSVMPPDARALFFGGANAPLFQTNLVDSELQARNAAPPVAQALRRSRATAIVQQLGIRYNVAKQLANGQFATAIPNETLDASDQFAVKLQPNDAGYLWVFERGPNGWQGVAESRIDRLAVYTLPPSGALTFDNSGTKELFVVFSRQPQPAPYPVPQVRLDQITTANLQERWTYVASRNANAEGQTVAFPITLTHK